jgi:hypothetical protein
MNRIRLPTLGALLVAACLARAADDRGVTIEKSPPQVETKFFDPARPPAEMPALQANEAAVTASKYSCESQIGVTVKIDDSRPTHYVATIDSVTVKVTLGITIWLPNHAAQKIVAHENGHRQISEIFYTDADKIARELAQRYIDKTLIADGRDRQKAVDDAISKQLAEINNAYMEKVQTPSQKAQEAFDQITDHGRNQVKEDDAVKKAVGTKT